jgi:uncharacterized protein YndB with AHSA1/START domain
MDIPASEPLEREIRIAARPETVFAFFIDPQKMIQWKGLRAKLDPRPGGIYQVEINGRDVARGEYVEIVPYRRIVFTWGWEGEHSPLPPGTTTVEVSFIEEGGHTIVRLKHLGLPPAQRGVHAEGWDHFLPRLMAVAEGRQPEPDPWIM